jgi:hypothetical protein
VRIDMSCNPGNPLWAGCSFEEVGGRFNMTTPTAEASNLVGRACPAEIDGEPVTLSGPAPIWAYLVVFHQVLHKTKRVYFDDGRNPAFPIAAHN